MDPKAFIQSMTVWNWLTLIVFPLALLGGLNSFFSLKSRYLDWRGTKTKKKFEKRMRQLETELNKIERYKENPIGFIVQILEDTIRPLGLSFGSLVLFIGAFAIYRIPLPGFLIFEFVYLILSISLMVYATFALGTLYKRLTRVNHPRGFGLEVFQFINNGKKKGFISKDDYRLIDLLIENKLIPAGNSDRLRRAQIQDKKKQSQ